MKNPFPRTILVTVLLAKCLAFAPIALAVDPPPDGGYPGQNTAEGDNALFSLTTGVDNTAVGFHALMANTTGSENTATGYNTLATNSTGDSNTAFGWQALTASIGLAASVSACAPHARVRSRCLF